MNIKIKTNKYVLSLTVAPRCEDVYHLSLYRHESKDEEERIGTLWPRSYGIFELTLTDLWRQKYADRWNDGTPEPSQSRVYARVGSAQGLIQYFFDVLDTQARNDLANSKALARWGVYTSEGPLLLRKTHQRCS